jgi:flavin-dependent dehydrogenase
VRGLARDGAGVRLLLTPGEPAVRADAVLLATGKHDLRGAPRQGVPSTLIGLKLHLRLASEAAQALAGQVELVLFEGGYAGLQAVEGGVANLCLVVEKGRFAALGCDWRRLVATVPHLERRLDGASACWPDPLAVYRIPYGYLHRADEAVAGPVYRLGDQLAVIPSFTGDGMAMALRSAAQAAAAVLAGLPPAAYHRRMVKAFAPQLRLAGAVAGFSAVAALQAPLVAACRALPGLMTAIAARTRSPSRA